MQKRTIQKNRSSLTSWSFKVITQEVHEAIWQMRQSGYSQRRTALELDLHRRTVKSYWDREPGTVPPLTRTRAKWSDGHESRLRELFRETRNCDVVRRRLIEENVPVPSLRSVQKALKPFRSELKAAQAAKACQRVESLPGDVMQIDFGVKSLIIGGKQTKAHFFVAVLAYSRRRYVLITENEDCTSWLQGIEGAFRRFGGIPNTILCDNAKALVTKAGHVGGERHFKPNQRFEQFCHYWGVTPIASMPRYPQSKGKVERTVGYVKQNCLAHPVSESWEALKAHVTHWLDTVADAKVIRAADGTQFATMERFAEEKPYLKTMERPSERGSVRISVSGKVIPGSSPMRLLFVFRDVVCQTDALAGAKVEGPARSAGGSSLAPANARREAAGAEARAV